MDCEHAAYGLGKIVSDNNLLASSKVLNTQTSMGCNEFIQYVWRDDRDTDVSTERQIFNIPLDVNDDKYY